MRDLWHLFRGSLPRLEGLSYSFEKAGLKVDGQAIPWSADSVLVKGVVEFPFKAVCAKSDFELHVGTESFLPSRQRSEEADERIAVQFRLPVPAKSTFAELFWQGRSLGQITLPVLSPAEFTRKLVLALPTASVRLREQSIACQTYVTTQGKGLIVAGILQSPTSLLPILDLGLRVELSREEGGPISTTPVLLSSSQLKACQALVTVVPPRPKQAGTWRITWYLADAPLAAQTVRAITQAQFLRSLRITATRFVLQPKRGPLKVEKTLPDLKGYTRAGPCFLVSSSEAGMAGWCTLQVRAHAKIAGAAPVLQEHEVLLSDGPFPFVPGTLEVSDLAKVKQFELRCGRNVLGTLSPVPVPSAAFTQEGGFVPAESFEWTASAEELLQERLGKLLGP